MSAPPVLEKIVAVHLQEFGSLERQCSTALRSPDFRLADVRRLQARAAAHLDGLVTAAASDLAAMAAHLQDEDPEAVFAACVALLELRTPEAASEALQALRQVPPEQIDVLRRALLHGPVEPVEDTLREIAVAAPPHIAAAAMEALLYHGRTNVTTDRLTEFVRHEDPAVRAAAWRIVALTPYSLRSA